MYLCITFRAETLHWATCALGVWLDRIVASFCVHAYACMKILVTSVYWWTLKPATLIHLSPSVFLRRGDVTAGSLPCPPSSLSPHWSTLRYFLQICCRGSILRRALTASSPPPSPPQHPHAPSVPTEWGTSFSFFCCFLFFIFPPKHSSLFCTGSHWGKCEL